MLRIVLFFVFLIFSCGHALSFDLDLTVDDDIRKNYNSSQLVKDTNLEELEDLPELPSSLKYESKDSTSQVSKPDYISSQVPSKIIATGNVKIHKGTSFNVVSTTKISDWQTAGSTVKFVTKNQISNKKYVIPASTVFIGEIIESHQPQISCNGGLVVIRVNSMIYKGKTVPMSAYVTRADNKMIFLNNIKGKRTYLKTLWNKGGWGRSMFDRMMTLTVKLGGDNSTVLLSPFPAVYGTLCFGLNALASPITAFFSKGGHVSIPSGSQFRIKLLDDMYID